MQKQTEWKWKIEATSRWFQWNLTEIWQYKDRDLNYVLRFDNSLL